MEEEAVRADSVVSPPPPLSSAAEDVLNRTIEAKSSEEGINNLDEYFEIQSTAELVRTHGFKKVALQFPDELLQHSPSVFSKLETAINDAGVKLFILGDTSYGSCCVDEVAAEHLRADVVIHYGRACLSATSRLPVFYVYGRRHVDVNNFVEEFIKTFPLNDTTKNAVIFYDVWYHHAVPELNKALEEKGYTKERAIFTSLKTFQEAYQKKVTQPTTSNEPPTAAGTGCGSCDCEVRTCGVMQKEDTQVQETASEGNVILGRSFKLPEDKKMSDYSILYIGEESITLTNLLMTHNSLNIYRYNPDTRQLQKETLAVNRSLLKRYYLVQRAKDAEVIGIAVGTLGVAKYLEIIDHLKKLIKQAGKKHYVFVVGKLNPAKLANFEYVDIFVIVACPENSLIDSKEAQFFKPIVTPYELQLALEGEREWTGEFLTDFSQILPRMASAGDEESKEKEMKEKEGSDGEGHDEEGGDFESDEDAPRFSLIDMKLKPKHVPSQQKEGEEGEEDASKELAVLNSERSLATISPAAAYLMKRGWKGLEQKLGETEVVLAVEGDEGLPMAYTHEKETLNVEKKKKDTEEEESEKEDTGDDDEKEK